MQTNGTVKCGAGKMPGVGRASRRERLPRTAMVRVFAVGVALLSAPAPAQSAIPAPYALSPPAHIETLAHSEAQSMRASTGARPWLSPDDASASAWGRRVIQVNLRFDALPGMHREHKIGPMPADTTSLRMPAGQPFQLSTTSLVGGEPLVRTWQGIQARMRAEMTNMALCQNQMCSPAAQKLERIIAEGRAQSGLARIGVINRAINLAIKPTDDPYMWHSPLEALSMGVGDCKDYAVTKYFALLEAGVAEWDVKLLIVHDVKVNQDHAIVAVRFDGDWIILDNRWLALVRDVEMHRAIPLYVLDGDGVSRFDRRQARSNSPAQNDVPADKIRVLDQPEDCKAAEETLATRRACQRR